MPARLPFPIARCPDEFPGKHIWFTLRFAGTPPRGLPGVPWGGFVLAAIRRTEWVDGAVLAVGDELLDGPIIGRTEIAGEPCWKIDTGKRTTRWLPIAAQHGTQIERVIKTAPTRNARLEYDGEPEAFDPDALDKLLLRIHERDPLIAVVFQDGNWFDGTPLVDLDDAVLVARLRKKPRATARSS